MATYQWEETATPNNTAGGYTTIYFTPIYFGARHDCIIKKLTLRSATNSATLPTVPVYAKIIDPDATATAMTVSQAVSMTAVDTDYTFVFAKKAMLTHNKQYRLVFYSGEADGSPQTAIGVRLAVMSDAQLIYYGNNQTWRPITRVEYETETRVNIGAWTGWDYKQLAIGCRGEKGPRGVVGVVGVTGPTGPTGIGLKGAMGRRGPAGALMKGPKAPYSRLLPLQTEEYVTWYVYQPLIFIEHSTNGVPDQWDGWSGGLIDARTQSMEYPQSTWDLILLKHTEAHDQTTGKIEIETLFVHDRYRSDRDEKVFKRTISVDAPESGRVELITVSSTGIVYWDIDSKKLIWYHYDSNSGYEYIIEASPLATGQAVYPQVDTAPLDGQDLQLVTSGGVADAYCALIDKIKEYKPSLTTAQVAAMKALFGG